MKILFATDGSVNADNALQKVLEREWPAGSSCRVVSIAEPLHKTLNAALFGIGDLAKRAQAEMEKDLQSHLQECVEKLSGKFGKDNVTSELIKGSPKVELVQMAKTNKSDLIIVGSHGNDPDDNWFSSVTRALVSSAPCNVEILNPQSLASVEIKEETHRLQPSRNLVAVSSEHNAEQILATITNRPWPGDSLFRIICVVNPAAQKQSRLFKSKEVEELRAQALSAAKKSAEKLVKETAAKLEDKFPATQLTSEVLEGSPRNVILQTAQDWPADLIMMGSHEHDHDRLEHFLGSTAAAVVWNAECSVELVKLSK
jgi:nucleotide-binding universal stress UspA family protein